MRIARNRITLTLAGAAVAAAVSTGATQALRAQEEPARPVAESAGESVAPASVRERLDQLFPPLLSGDADAKARAEKEIVKLGEPARQELEKIARETDPKRSKAALELLASDRWDAAPHTRGGDGTHDGTDRLGFRRLDLEKLDARMQKQLDEIRERMRAWEKDFRFPDLDDFEWRRWAPEIDVGREGFHGSSSGSVIENGRKFAWSVADDGRVKVTEQESADAPERTYEAANLDALRKEHPDVARRLDGLLPQGDRRFVFVWPPRHRLQRDTTAPDVHDGQAPATPGLERVPAGTAPGPVLGVRCSAVPELLREHLDLPDGGIVIESVLPGTLAARLGLERNDVVLRLAGDSVAGPADVARVLEAAPREGEIAAEIVRKGRRITLTATR